MKCILPDVEQAIEMLMKQDRPAMIVVDSNGLGLGVVSSLQRKHGTFKVKSSDNAAANKIERFGVAMQYVYSSKVYLPFAASWLETWLYEMIAFPNSEYDDQVDSFTQVVSQFETVARYARDALVRA